MNNPQFKIGDRVMWDCSSFRGQWMTVVQRFKDIDNQEYFYNCDQNAWDKEREPRFKAYAEKELIKLKKKDK